MILRIFSINVGVVDIAAVKHHVSHLIYQIDLVVEFLVNFLLA